MRICFNHILWFNSMPIFFLQFIAKEFVKRSCGNAVGLVAAFVAVA